MVDKLTSPIELTPFEAEHYIETLEPINLETIGGKEFLDIHEKVEKLSTV